jgi:diaminopimelate decarboxylase
MPANLPSAASLTPNQRWSIILVNTLPTTRTNQKRRNSLDSFNYKDGVLHIEGCSIAKINGAVGTPFYAYSQSNIEAAYDRLNSAFDGMDVSIFFAIKANSNPAVIKVLSERGAGADIVSEGELRLAEAAGVSPEKIVFAGVGKTKREMAYALQKGIHQFSVESPIELEALNEVALSLGKVAPVTLRINPDVDAKTDSRITTGKADNKFGVDAGDALALAQRALSLKGISIDGLSVHIGSQLMDLKPYREAYERLTALAEKFIANGFALKHLDLGGGVGIAYDLGQAPDVKDYAEIVRETVAKLGLPMMVEPGRSLVAQAGIMVSEVIYTKETANKEFAIIDAAMNDLIRPALYQAHHEIQPVLEPRNNAPKRAWDIVGPVCESTDTFIEEFDLPELVAGDLLTFRSAGAYGAVMASEYNGRPLIPEVLVKGEQFAVIRKRPDYQEMLNRFSPADWAK